MPSGSREFKELTKRDAQIQLGHELEGLLGTATVDDEAKKTIEQEFQGFQRLFERFLLDQGPTINWDRIEKLPENAVRVRIGSTPVGSNFFKFIFKFILLLVRTRDWYREI